MPLTGRQPILQVHPTRRCNLSCLHCYSDSGPAATDVLPLAVLTDAVDDAVGLGYGVLSVSGGEPLMYRHLVPLLRHARDAGMRTLVTTNGTLGTDARLSRLAPQLDLLALSLDGPAAEHDRMRGQAGVFERLLSGLPALRRAGIPFGFLVTLTQYNVHQLEWAAEFAVQQEAALLQVHPLQPVGRGAGLTDELPDALESSFAAIEVARLRARYGSALSIEVDVTTRASLEVLAALPADVDRLVDWASPLVIEPDGVCVPFEYGFPRGYALGDITAARLADLAPAWCRDRLPAFRQLCQAALDRLRAPDGPPVSYWYAEVRAEAEATAARR